MPGFIDTRNHLSTHRRQADDDGVYSVNIMADDKRIHGVAGRESDGTTRTQAEELIAKVRTDAKHNRLSLPKGRKVPVEFDAAATRHLERLLEEGDKELKARKHRLEDRLLPFCGRLGPSNPLSIDGR